MTVSYETFQRQKYPKFGHYNAELMNCEFWKYMVETGYSAWEAREEFGCTNRLREGPIWSFQRYGMSSNSLADGRVIYIGGEHEDGRDPDFCIYNDVIVKCTEGEINIYTYPIDIFPPTDFHSATLVDNKIFIVGCLGHLQDRCTQTTRVYCLDCDDFTIEKIETQGKNPGWIYKHDAEFIPEKNCIKIAKGYIFQLAEGEEIYTENTDIFWLNLSNRQWFRGEIPF
ncbi:ankyrin repeat-containing protein [Calothrix sp. NIES-4101]|nr:ankyrin repeat-containing protein [Calothrix sp. NIES-4101]